jgi:hypothetical protein
MCRIEVARAVRKFPVALEMLSTGSLSLTTLRLLAPHLEPDNHERVLAAASGRTKFEVLELIARLSPKPDPAPTVRRLPASSGPLSVPLPMGEPPTASPPAPPRRAVVSPLAPGRYTLPLTLTAETDEKLQCAKALLRHVLPNGDANVVFDRALDALLVDLARKKFGATDRPRRSQGASLDPYYVPNWVKRIVWVRDRGRCRFVAESGRRCNERSFVEFHHVTPPSGGGKADPANTQLRCAGHNGYEADVYYGPREPKDAPSVVRENRAGYETTQPTRSGTSSAPRPRRGTSCSSSPGSRTDSKTSPTTSPCG